MHITGSELIKSTEQLNGEDRFEQTSGGRGQSSGHETLTDKLGAMGGQDIYSS